MALNSPGQIIIITNTIIITTELTVMDMNTQKYMNIYWWMANKAIGIVQVSYPISLTLRWVTLLTKQKWRNRGLEKMKEVAQIPWPGKGRARIQTRKSPWYSRAPKYLFLQLNSAVRHGLLKNAKICKRPAGMLSSMVGIRGAYRKKPFWYPALLLPWGQVSHCNQVKTELD